MRNGKIQSLDGMRAVCIGLVLLGHLSGTKNIGIIDLGIGDYAHLGVVVFFVLSGFLITTLMVEEEKCYGQVSLRLFYVRRVLRLMPAAVAYLVCVGILNKAGLIHLQTRDWQHVLTYTVNYEWRPSWWIAHLWSLSIEEQFYFLWPIAFVIAGRRHRVWVAVAAVLLGPAGRSVQWLLYRGTPYFGRQTFTVVSDSLGLGCLLALQKDWLERQTWYLKLLQPLPSLALVACLCLCNRRGDYRTIDTVAGRFLINCFTAILIHRCICATDWSVKLLNYRPIVFIGVLSYSVYMWQELFLVQAFTPLVPYGFPFNLICVAAATAASYLLLERPVLRLRQQLKLRPQPREKQEMAMAQVSSAS